MNVAAIAQKGISLNDNLLCVGVTTTGGCVGASVGGALIVGSSAGIGAIVGGALAAAFLSTKGFLWRRDSLAY